MPRFVETTYTTQRQLYTTTITKTTQADYTLTNASPIITPMASFSPHGSSESASHKVRRSPGFVLPWSYPSLDLLGSCTTHPLAVLQRGNAGRRPNRCHVPLVNSLGQTYETGMVECGQQQWRHAILRVCGVDKCGVAVGHDAVHFHAVDGFLPVPTLPIHLRIPRSRYRLPLSD